MNWIFRRAAGTPELSYAELGDPAAPPMVLLHGVTRCGMDWEPVAAGLALNWRVIAVDHRGHGGSERAESYRVVDYVTDAVRLLRYELRVPVAVVGHSLGAMVGAALAAEVPSLVRALVLEDPPFFSMGEGIVGTPWQVQFSGMQRAARQCAVGCDLTDLLAAIQIPQSDGGTKPLGQLRTQESLRWSAECLKRVDPAVFEPLVSGRWLDGYNVEQICAGVECPTLLMQADPTRGGALADSDALVVASALRLCRLERFSGAGHQLHRDATGDFTERMAEFFATLAAPVFPAPFREV